MEVGLRSKAHLADFWDKMKPGDRREVIKVKGSDSDDSSGEGSKAGGGTSTPKSASGRRNSGRRTRTSSATSNAGVGAGGGSGSGGGGGSAGSRNRRLARAMRRRSAGAAAQLHFVESPAGRGGSAAGAVTSSGTPSAPTESGGSPASNPATPGGGGCDKRGDTSDAGAGGGAGDGGGGGDGGGDGGDKCDPCNTSGRMSLRGDDDAPSGGGGADVWPWCVVQWKGTAVVEDLFSSTLARVGTARDTVARQIGHRLQVRWAHGMAMDLILAEENEQKVVPEVRGVVGLPLAL